MTENYNKNNSEESVIMEFCETNDTKFIIDYNMKELTKLLQSKKNDEYVRVETIYSSFDDDEYSSNKRDTDEITIILSLYDKNMDTFKYLFNFKRSEEIVYNHFTKKKYKSHNNKDTTRYPRTYIYPGEFEIEEKKTKRKVTLNIHENLYPSEIFNNKKIIGFDKYERIRETNIDILDFEVRVPCMTRHYKARQGYKKNMLFDEYKYDPNNLTANKNYICDEKIIIDENYIRYLVNRVGYKAYEY